MSRTAAFLRAAAAAALVAAPVAAGPVPAAAQRIDAASLPTRAEATEWVETSRYDDVMAFVRTVAAASDRIHLTTMGYTTEGRSIPLLVVGDVADASPGAVAASGKLRVYLQGNIHGGEVPGKEALLMLLRDVAAGADRGWLDDLVLLVAPVYNADGNERVALGNRPRQHGPLGGMGQRPNAQGLDLNRDHMKLDSPEARSLADMLTRYDPQVGVDLHTTNGTLHAYHLTYSPPLHPGTDEGIVALLRDAWLPDVTRAMGDEHDQLVYYYGNASDRSGETGWYTFDHRPRFNNNYLGLRNRVAILSEAYAYLTFRDRVFSTLRFVEEILDWAATHAGRIGEVVERADAASVVGRPLPTRATFERSDERVEILMGDVARERHPWTGEVIYRRLEVVTPTPMWEYGTFRGTETEVAPSRYLIPPEHDDVIARLEAHGVRVTRSARPRRMEVEAFEVVSAEVAERPFQGRNERTLFGAWRPGEREIPAGTAEIDVSQPLGRLAFYLLEPRSDDGFAAWGILDEAMEAEGGAYPVLRVR